MEAHGPHAVLVHSLLGAWVGVYVRGHNWGGGAPPSPKMHQGVRGSVGAFLGGDAGRGGCLAIFRTPLPSSRVTRKGADSLGAVPSMATAYWWPMIAQCLFWAPVAFSLFLLPDGLWAGGMVRLLGPPCVFCCLMAFPVVVRQCVTRHPELGAVRS